MTLQDHHCQVLENRTCGENLKVLLLETQGSVFECQPGQFVMLDLPDPRFFFRRPFSVFRTHGQTRLEIFYKIVGVGTRMIAEFQPGQSIKILGPLGNTFFTQRISGQVLMIGGGIGIAPLYFLGQQLRKTQAQVEATCFYGVRSRSELGLLEELTDVFGADRLFISTDDGSYGEAGFVTQQLERQVELIQNAEMAYICGPTVMMKAVSQLLRQMNPKIHMEVSLEEHMPCGTGACTGCVVQRADQLLPSKVCVEGPVFQRDQIVWPGDELGVPVQQGGGSVCPRL